MNYVILYPDEMRAESLACYGHPTVKTPNIDALAAEGTLFEQNYSAHPVCVASRCSLVTGWYPHVKGYRSQYNLMKDTETTFIAELNQAGYTTALAGKDDCFDKESNQRIFGEYMPFRGGSRPVMDGKKHYDMIMPASPDGQLEKNIDVVCAEDSSDFIRRHSKDDKPFVLWVNFLAPHPPYTAPETFFNMYSEKDVPPQRTEDWLEGKPSTYKYCKYYREADQEPEGTFVRMNAVYLGMISFVDALVGRIVKTLKEQGIYEDTTIILCSDHGDFAGDANLCEKTPNGLDDMLTRVPLIVRRPGCPGGHRVKELTQSIDIFPTIFDYESLEMGHDQFGVSLKPQIDGAAGDPDRVVYAEGGYDTREMQCFELLGPEGSARRKFMGPGSIYYPKFMHQEHQPESVCRAVMRRDSKYKIVLRTNGEHELYDMEADPLEYRNLYGNPAYEALFQELSNKTLLWLLHTSDVVPHVSGEAPAWFAEKKDEK